MRVFLGLTGAVALLLGGCIAEGQGRYVALQAPDAVKFCNGVVDGADQGRCRRAFARDAAQAEAAETVRLRYAMRQVGAGLARSDDPRRAIRCDESRVDGRLVTSCAGAPRP